MPLLRGSVRATHILDDHKLASREDVDRRWEWVLAQNVVTESAPKEFPHYVEGYYAAFFYDPSGIKARSRPQADAGRHDVLLISRSSRRGEARVPEGSGTYLDGAGLPRWCARAAGVKRSPVFDSFVTIA